MCGGHPRPPVEDPSVVEPPGAELWDRLGLVEETELGAPGGVVALQPLTQPIASPYMTAENASGRSAHASRAQPIASTVC